MKFKNRKQKHRKLKARIIIKETMCGFVKLSYSFPKSCLGDKSMVYLFQKAWITINEDVMPLQTRMRINDDRIKQKCEILFTRPADPKANLVMGIDYEVPNRVNKPTPYEAIKYISLPTLAERLDEYILHKHNL